MEVSASSKNQHSNGQGERSAATLHLDDAGGSRPGAPDPDDLASLRPRRPPGPSTKPALIVVGIAAALMIAGAVAGGLTGGSTPPVSGSVFTAKGAPLRAETARNALSRITSSGLPPTDIVAALALPKGTSVITGSTQNNGVGSYDRSIGLRVIASNQDVISFFRAQLPAEHWRIISQGPPSNSTGFQIVSQHPGSNGYEWELGITVKPESFGTTVPAGAANSTGSAAADSTNYTLRLFEVTDTQ